MMKKVMSASLAAALVLSTSASVFADTLDNGNSSVRAYFNSVATTDSLDNTTTYNSAVVAAKGAVKVAYDLAVSKDTSVLAGGGTTTVTEAQRTLALAVADAAIDAADKAKNAADKAWDLGVAADNSLVKDKAEVLQARAIEQRELAQGYRKAIAALTVDTSLQTLAKAETTKAVEAAQQALAIADEAVAATKNVLSNNGDVNKASQNRTEHAFAIDALIKAIAEAKLLSDWNYNYGYARDYSSASKELFDAEITRAEQLLAKNRVTTKGIDTSLVGGTTEVTPSDSTALDSDYTKATNNMLKEVDALVSESMRLIRTRFTDTKTWAEEYSRNNLATWSNVSSVIAKEKAKVDDLNVSDIVTNYTAANYAYRTNTAGSWTANSAFTREIMIFSEARKNALPVVDEAIRAIEKAVGNVVDLSTLKAQIDRATALNKSNFTSDLFTMWDAMQVALTEANTVYKKLNATQTEVENATTKLKTALDKLTANTDIQVRLQSILAKIAKLNPHDYTSESWAALTKAVDAAKKYVSSLTVAQTADTDAAMALLALEQALDALVSQGSSSTSTSTAPIESSSTPINKNVPKTGDNTPFAATMVVLLVAAAGATVVVRKRSLTK